MVSWTVPRMAWLRACGLSLLLVGVAVGAGIAADEEEKTHWGEHPLYKPRVDYKKAASKNGSTGHHDMVTKSLVWLRKHQHDDGAWSGKNFTHCCEDSDEPCSPDIRVRAKQKPGIDDIETGLTGLALLALMARGNTHIAAENEPTRIAIEKGMRYLIEEQEKTGDKGKRGQIGRSKYEQQHYCHAIATLALAELLLGSGDKDTLEEPVKLATEYALDIQNPGYGWGYLRRKGNDTSVTLWMAAAMKTVAACIQADLLDVELKSLATSLDGTVKWLDKVTSIRGVTGYQMPGDPGSQLIAAYPDPFPFSKDFCPANTAAAVFMRSLIGVGDKNPRDSIQRVADRPPRWRLREGKKLSTINFYYWYYGTHAMFQQGGATWKEWNRALRKALKKGQRRTGCEKGSWDPVGEWAIEGGRVYATAINSLSLQASYRYSRVKARK